MGRSKPNPPGKGVARNLVDESTGGGKRAGDLGGRTDTSSTEVVAAIELSVIAGLSGIGSSSTSIEALCSSTTTSACGGPGVGDLRGLG